MSAHPLFAAVYDRMLAASERAGLAEARRQLLAPLRGVVLEVGAGTGLNLPHYPAGLDRLLLTEPDHAMARRLRARLEATVGDVAAEVIEAPAQALPLPSSSVDEAVSTLVLCSVTDPTIEGAAGAHAGRLAAAAEVARVLRPGGRFHFIEHVAGNDGEPTRLQRLVAPVQRVAAGGCRLDLSMVELLRATGWDIVDIRDWRLPAVPPWAAPAVVGTAVRCER